MMQAVRDWNAYPQFLLLEPRRVFLAGLPARLSSAMKMPKQSAAILRLQKAQPGAKASPNKAAPPVGNAGIAAVVKAVGKPPAKASAEASAAKGKGQGKGKAESELPAGPPAGAPVKHRLHPMAQSPSKRVKSESGQQRADAGLTAKRERTPEFKAGQAQKRRFENTLNPNSRNAAPESVILALAADPSSKPSWLASWSAEGENWAWAEAREVQQEKTETVDEDSQVWLTVTQMLKEGLDPVLIEALKKYCELDPKLWRPHPICPHIKEGIEYKVPVRELSQTRRSNVSKKSVEGTANVDLKHASMLASTLRGSLHPPPKAAAPGAASVDPGTAAVVPGAAAVVPGAPAGNAGLPEGKAGPPKSKEEIEAEQAEIKRLKKLALDQKKELPENKAKIWFSNLNSKIDELCNAVRKCKDENSNVSAEVRGVYGTKFDALVVSCSGLRSAIGSLRAGNASDKSILDKISEAEPVMQNAKNIMAEFSGILRSNNKAAEKAKPAEPTKAADGNA